MGGLFLFGKPSGVDPQRAERVSTPDYCLYLPHIIIFFNTFKTGKKTNGCPTRGIKGPTLFFYPKNDRPSRTQPEILNPDAKI